MLQRIQTVWLLIAGALLLLTVKFPFYAGTDEIEMVYKNLDATSNLLTLIVTSTLGTLILVTIFLFKNRKLQFRLVLLCVLLECLVVYLYTRQISTFMNGGISIWAIVHPLVLIFLIMALRGIHKDNKLIKDSDRLR